MDRTAQKLDKPLLWILAIGSGVGVSTIYLAQPLMRLLMVSLNSTVERIGMIVTMTQLGYGVGILFLVPLGDITNRRTLILFKLLALFAGLMLLSVSQDVLMFWLGSFTVGIFATVAQDFVPLAADLAEPSERGRIVGTVTSGLLIGILGSRVFSGFIAERFGWRAPFIGAAAAVLLILLAFGKKAPDFEPNAKLTYARAMQSVLHLLRAHWPLQKALLVHGLVGMCFSAFWTNVAFHLSGPEFSLPTWQIGALGLAGIAGALGAPLAGRISDRRGPRASIAVAIALVLFSFVGMWLAPFSLIVLIAATIVFDLGVQVSLVSHQSLVYALDSSARSRLNAVFVSGLFVFFAVGSWLGTLVFAHAGWNGVLGLGIGCAGTSLLLALQGLRKGG
jgi:predicted MFS family arabinose efflux permease